MNDSTKAGQRGILFRSMAVWLLLICAEIGHGILRAILLVPIVGEFRSNQIGVFTGSAIILVIAYFTVSVLSSRVDVGGSVMGFFPRFGETRGTIAQPSTRPAVARATRAI